ncbi:MAG: hypothetical protein WCJ56_01085 [bacterium]
MSCTVSVFTAPSLFPAGIGLGTAAATAGIVALAGYGSYVAIQRLRRDYQETYCEFNTRALEHAQLRIEFTAQNSAAATMAASLAASTLVQANEAATLTFLHEHLDMLAERIPMMPDPNPDLAARCQLLLESLAADPDNIEEIVTQYRGIFEEYAAAIAKSGSGLKEGLADELLLLRSELRAPFFATAAGQKLHEQFLTQLTHMEAVAKRQPAVAAQGIALLQTRIHRELQTWAEQQTRQAKEATEMRMRVGDMLGKLQALSNQTYMQYFSDRATVLLQQLNAALTAQESDAFTAVRKLSTEVDELYAACEKTLEEQTMAAYLQDQLSDVLLSMGYNVSQVPAEQKLLASVDNQVGLEFHLGENGRIDTEMVALKQSAAKSGAENEERVCNLADKVFKALAQRDIEVRERFRTHLDDDEELRVVEMPEQQTTAVKHAEQPRKMTLDNE